jgi:hypothetical protein
MKELIDKLTSDAGITESQAYASVNIIKEFAKQRFPVFAGAIDRLFDRYGPKEEEDYLDQ